jgi:hypothetical protein
MMILLQLWPLLAPQLLHFQHSPSGSMRAPQSAQLGEVASRHAK